MKKLASLTVSPAPEFTDVAAVVQTLCAHLVDSRGLRTNEVWVALSVGDTLTAVFLPEEPTTSTSGCKHAIYAQVSLPDSGTVGIATKLTKEIGNIVRDLKGKTGSLAVIAALTGDRTDVIELDVYGHSFEVTDHGIRSGEVWS